MTAVHLTKPPPENATDQEKMVWLSHAQNLLVWQERLLAQLHQLMKAGQVQAVSALLERHHTDPSFRGLAN